MGLDNVLQVKIENEVAEEEVRNREKVSSGAFWINRRGERQRRQLTCIAPCGGLEGPRSSSGPLERFGIPCIERGHLEQLTRGRYYTPRKRDKRKTGESTDSIHLYGSSWWPAKPTSPFFRSLGGGSLCSQSGSLCSHSGSKRSTGNITNARSSPRLGSSKTSSGILGSPNKKAVVCGDPVAVARESKVAVHSGS
jgi:hypothetical protein